MRALSTLLLVTAALTLGWIAYNATEASYVPPDPEAGLPRALPAAAPAGLELRRYAVDGMCCEGCVRKLYERLVAVTGVESAAIDFESGEAMVHVAASAPDAQLLAALNWDKYVAEPLP